MNGFDASGGKKPLRPAKPEWSQPAIRARIYPVQHSTIIIS